MPTMRTAFHYNKGSAKAPTKILRRFIPSSLQIVACHSCLPSLSSQAGPFRRQHQPLQLFWIVKTQKIRVSVGADDGGRQESSVTVTVPARPASRPFAANAERLTATQLPVRRCTALTDLCRSRASSIPAVEITEAACYALFYAKSCKP